MPVNDDKSGRTVSHELALSDRNINFTLIGLSLAIFTFSLIFLYNRVSTGTIDPILFQITLGDAVGATFCFAVSGLYNYILLFSVQRDPDSVVLSQRRRAELFFSLALFLLLLEPALILFTVGLVPVASAALILFFAYLAAYSYSHQKMIPKL